MIPLLSGGAYRRPGTMFQDYMTADPSTPEPSLLINQSASSPPRVIPFIVSNVQAYAVVIGTMRWSEFDSGADPGDPAGFPGGGYMQWYRATGNTNEAYEGGTIGYGQLPYRAKAIDVAVSGTTQCDFVRQGGPGAVANSGVNADAAAIIDIADSLQTFDDDVWSVQYCQANDVMFLTHPDYPPQAIYVEADNLTLNTLSVVTGLPSAGLGLPQSRPYLNQNSTAVTLEVSWVMGQNIPGGVGTLTASANLFKPLHGPLKGVSFDPDGTSGAIFAFAVGEGNAMTGNNTDNGIVFMLVTAVNSATQCTVTFLNAVPSNTSKNTPTTSWWESAWSNFRGWPSSCAIFEQRLCFASTIHQPNAFWFTATTAYGVSTTSFPTSLCKFSALGDGPDQGLVQGVTGTLANGQNYETPANWYYAPVDDSQGDGQSTGPLGIQPFRISLATTSLDAIQYISPDQQLFVGTATQEWIIAPVNGAFDVANSTCTIQSHYGSDYVQAIRIGYELMFILQNKQEVRAYQYNYFDQSFFGEPVQLFFDEYPMAEESASDFVNPYTGRRKVRQIDWDASRSTLWNVDTAGNLYGLTRDRKLSITTWHTHQLGGFNPNHGQGQNMTTNLTESNNYTDSAYFQCDGSVISAASVPNPLSGIRDLWLIVKRSFAATNNTIWCVERIVGANTVRSSAYSAIAPGNAQEPLYIDSAYFLTDNGDPDNVNYNVGGQLIGQTLQGTYYSEAWGMFALTTQGPVVDAGSPFGPVGSLNLQEDLPEDYGTDETHTMVVGLPYNSIVQPVRPDMPSQIGTAQGAIKRPSKAYVRVFKTLMFKMGAPPPGKLETVRFKPAAQEGKSSEIYTGDKEVFLPAQYDRDGYIYLLQDQPLPFTLVSFSLEGAEYEQ